MENVKISSSAPSIEPVMNDCQICGEKFNKIKKQTSCPKCNFICCKHCIQQYILSRTDEPHCMNCKTQFSDEFLYQNVNKTFMNQTYKEHKKQIMFDIEKSRIPETMPNVENYVEVKKLEENNEEIKKEINALRVQLRQLEINKAQNDNTIFHLRNGVYQTKKEVRKFNHKCPVENCNGFLSSQWKCAACDTWTCPKCFDIIGENKNVEHTCKKENIESANLIKKETRPCPKCAVPIFKISGCDQMWCTQCAIAFSWNTGKIVQGGVIHNPHYFQFMRNGGVLQNARQPGDVVCGGIPRVWELAQNHNSIIKRLINVMKNINKSEKEPEFENHLSEQSKKNFKKIKNMKEQISKFILQRPHKENASNQTYWIGPQRSFDKYLRCLGHNRDIIGDMRQRTAAAHNNVINRVRFIVGEMDENTFKNKLSRESRRISKERRILQVFEILETVTIENFNEIQRVMTNFMKVKLSELNFTDEYVKSLEEFLKTYNDCFNRCEEVAKYCREQVNMIKKNYNSKSYNINYYYLISV